MSTTRTLLAVDPGIREIGVALLRRDQLEDYQVKTLRRPRPGHTHVAVLERVVTGLLDKWGPDHVAITTTQPTVGADVVGLANILQTLEALLERRGVPASRMAWETVKRLVTSDASSTKWMVARAVCAQYPHLRSRLPTPGGRPERYALRMFSAVATGMAFMAMNEAVIHASHARS